ncbi:MAG: tetratricopeptide repeat protein [Candidatus Manganitrophus sp.]|nr:tetratricopeptide repeat protein [Candidatus Manganitrophus sp.]
MTGEEYLELGLAYMREKNWDSALNTLLESQKRFSDLPEENVPPVLFSALGVCYAMARNNIMSGLTYCQRAISMDQFQPNFYYNLGLIYLKTGDKKKALSIFRKGLKLNPEHSGIWSQISQLGFRKRPVLSFLPRQHFLNKYLGMWLMNAPVRRPSYRRSN